MDKKKQNRRRNRRKVGPCRQAVKVRRRRGELDGRGRRRTLRRRKLAGRGEVGPQTNSGGWLKEGPSLERRGLGEAPQRGQAERAGVCGSPLRGGGLRERRGLERQGLEGALWEGALQSRRALSRRWEALSPL